MGPHPEGVPVENLEVTTSSLKLWHPFRVLVIFPIRSGGLRYAATTGYSLAALQAEAFDSPLRLS